MTYIYLGSGLEVNEGIEMERQRFEQKAVPVAVDVPLHIREETRVMAVLCKYQSSRGGGEEREGGSEGGRKGGRGTIEVEWVREGKRERTGQRVA